MVARSRNSTSDNHCAIDRSICVRWHGVNQFLARRDIHGTFKQTGLRYSSRQLLSLRYGGVDVTRRIRVPACQMILGVPDMRRTPTIHELIVLTLPPRNRCPLDRLPASRLLLPRSGRERSDFVPWHKTEVPAGSEDVR
jgi:hypothetical protein